MGLAGSAVGGAAAGAAIGSIIPGIGTIAGGLIGGALGSLGGAGATAASAQQNKTSYDQLPWYERASATIGAKLEGVGNSAAGLLGFEDAFGTELQDSEKALKATRSDNAGVSLLNNSGAITGAGASGGGISGNNMALAPNNGNSLGRPIAITPDPALENNSQSDF